MHNMISFEATCKKKLGRTTIEFIILALVNYGKQTILKHEKAIKQLYPNPNQKNILLLLTFPFASGFSSTRPKKLTWFLLDKQFFISLLTSPDKTSPIVKYLARGTPPPHLNELS